MVRLDRGLLGVLLIAIVISTIIMSFVSVEKAEKKVEIIKNKYPSVIKTTIQETKRFAVNTISRDPHKQVDIKFNLLMKTDPPLSASNQIGDRDVPLSQMARDISPIKACLSMAEDFPVAYDNETVKVMVNGTSYEALFYDFGPLVSSGQSGIDMSFASTSFLLWMDENLTYYQGCSDFFLNKKETMESLSISHNDQETNFGSAKGSAGTSEMPTVADAPRLGTVTYEDVEKDDRMYILFAVSSLSVPEHQGLAQVIRVYGNGQLADYAINLIAPT